MNRLTADAVHNYAYHHFFNSILHHCSMLSGSRKFCDCHFSVQFFLQSIADICLKKFCLYAASSNIFSMKIP